MIVIVAGVAGSGKTTVGTQLATRLGWRFADADGFHPPANVAKMHAGVPLTDEDRVPWLRAIGAWMDDLIAAGRSGVVTCSALKRAYRDQLLSGRPAATMVLLQVSKDELERRLATRPGHFFPERLLDSQLETLQPPAPQERVLTVPEEGDDAADTVAEIIARLGLHAGLAWLREAEAGPARHLQPGRRDRPGAEGEVRRGGGEEGAFARDHPWQGFRSA